jgi:hypothetical protein
MPGLVLTAYTLREIVANGTNRTGLGIEVNNEKGTSPA